MKNAWLLGTCLALVGGWCAAENTVDEVVVAVPRTSVEIELRNYGVLIVKYRSPAAGFDDVVFVEKTRDIPVTAQGFGVNLVVDTNPRHSVRIAEVWSHPNLRNPETNEREAHTVLTHVLEPPDVFSVYFPLYDYGWIPGGEWALQLFLLDEPGEDGQNVSYDGDPVRFVASGAKPFFEYAFQVEGD